MTEENRTNSLREDVVEVISRDKKLIRKIVNIMIWLLVYCVILLTTTFCLFFYNKAETVISILGALKTIF